MRGALEANFDALLVDAEAALVRVLHVSASLLLTPIRVGETVAAQRAVFIKIIVRSFKIHVLQLTFWLWRDQVSER